MINFQENKEALIQKAKKVGFYQTNLMAVMMSGNLMSGEDAKEFFDESNPDGADQEFEKGLSELSVQLKEKAGALLTQEQSDRLVLTYTSTVMDTVIKISDRIYQKALEQENNGQEIDTDKYMDDTEKAAFEITIESEKLFYETALQEGFVKEQISGTLAVLNQLKPEIE